jgi:twitching motility protein PilT
VARIDVYLRSIERFGALGAVLASGKSVTLKFTTGDRHATQITPHDQLVTMVREIAPPQILDLIDRNRPARFEHASGGFTYSIAVATSQGQWSVSIDRAQPGEQPAAGAAGGAAGAAGKSATLAPPVATGGSMTIEPTAYEHKPWTTTAIAGPLVFEELIAVARRAGASDAYFMANALPLIRVGGEMMPLPDRAAALDAESLDKALGAIAPAEARAQWHDRGDTVFAHTSPDGSRLRVHWIRDRRGSGASIRLIPAEPPTADALGVPELARRLIEARRGLVVIAGGAGAGKTTTAAALVEHANNHRAALVVMIESPIEIPLDSRRCLISQREVGAHVRSLGDGVRAATREGADVIVLGRADDPDALAAALDAVSAGALVVVTITAAGIAPAVERIIELSGRVRGDAARGLVADALLGGVGQALCRRAAGGGRVAAYEVLVATGAVGGLVRDGKTYQLSSVMQTGRPQGMATLTDALADLVRRRVITGDEALRRSTSPQELRAVLAQASEA